MYQEAQRLDQQGQQRQAEAQRDAEERAAAAQRLIDTQKRAAELEAQARRERERVEAQAQQEKERAAEEARRQIQAQAAHGRLVARLSELGFELVGAVDLTLDWKSYMTKGTKIALDGTYVEDSDLEVLSTPDNKDHPKIRIYTDDASRDARKLMLECRNSDFKFSSCQMIVGGTVKNCIRNQGKLNEKEVPCLRVQEAFLKG
jgi:hypothetical protein